MLIQPLINVFIYIIIIIITSMYNSRDLSVTLGEEGPVWPAVLFKSVR